MRKRQIKPLAQAKGRMPGFKHAAFHLCLGCYLLPAGFAVDWTLGDAGRTRSARSALALSLLVT